MEHAGVDDPRAVRVDDNQIRVGADREGALTRIEAEDPRDVGGEHADDIGHGNPSGAYPARHERGQDRRHPRES